MDGGDGGEGGVEALAGAKADVPWSSVEGLMSPAAKSDSFTGCKVDGEEGSGAHESSFVSPSAYPVDGFMAGFEEDGCPPSVPPGPNICSLSFVGVPSPLPV